MLLEVVLARPPAVKARDIVSAILYDRLVKAMIPPTAAKLVVPCKVPVPVLRAARTTVLFSLEQRLPNWSSILMVGCCMNATPATALDEGCVCSVSRVARPGLMLNPALSPVERAPPVAVSFL